MADIKSFPNNQDVYVGAEWVMKWLHGRTSGVFGANGNAAVYAVPNSMSVEVSDGIGWISNEDGDGVVWWNDNERTNGEKIRLTHSTSDGTFDRIDRIVVTWMTTNYVALPTISILKGTPAKAPVPPALTNNGTQRQISLARVKIGAGSINIAQDAITDERLDPSVCGIVTDRVEIDTSVMQTQFEALLSNIKSELESLNSGTGFELKKLLFKNRIVAPEEFLPDETYSDYPYRVEIPLDGVTTSMIPDIFFSPGDALSGNFSSVAESYDGGVRVYATEIPESAISIPTIILWWGA